MAIYVKALYRELKADLKVEIDEMPSCKFLSVDQKEGLYKSMIDKIKQAIKEETGIDPEE